MPSGREVNLTRNTHGLITEVTETKAGKTQILLTSAIYVPFGQAKSFDSGNGKTTTRVHNLNGQLTSIMVNDVYQNVIGYNGDSTITTLTSALNPTSNQTYNYDELDRLTGATGSYGTIIYSYDSVSNRITKTDNGTESSLGYLTPSNQLDSPFIHDANGNRTRGDKRSFTYGEHNRLTEVTNDENGIKTTYLYNGLGQRVKKSNVFGEIYFLYDEQGLLIAEASDEGKVTKEYIYYESQPLVMDAIDTYYYHNDHLGTPQALTDNTASIVWKANYTPFGETDITIETVTNNLRFAGQYYDRESSLHYNYFRDYDPELGRYIQSDPIGLAGGINTYGYVEGNPVNYVDPLGLIKWKGKLGIQEFNVGVYAAQRVSMSVTSECHNGKVYSIEASGFGAGPGLGLNYKFIQSLKKLGSPSFTWTNISLDDGLSYIDASMFNGSFMNASANFSWGLGYSAGTSKFGQFKPWDFETDSMIGGMDAGSLSYILGNMSFDSLSETECECQ